jgi:hypothetical protein
MSKVATDLVGKTVQFYSWDTTGNKRPGLKGIVRLAAVGEKSVLLTCESDDGFLFSGSIEYDLVKVVSPVGALPTLVDEINNAWKGETDWKAVALDMSVDLIDRDVSAALVASIIKKHTK